MKKVLVLALVLSMASMANAALTLSATDTDLLPSETAILSISGDGQTLPGMFFLGVLVDGPGSLDIGSATVLYLGSDASLSVMDDPDIAAVLVVNNPFVGVSLMDVPPPGTEQKPLIDLLVDGIVFHCDGPGDVIVNLFDIDGVLLSSVTIQQPEPITIGLLGLGALFLRRRK